MSDTYQIDGVNVTPTGGGWYEITHDSLPEPEKIQGKEHADARAVEIAKTVSDDDGSMQEQGSLETIAIPSAGPVSDEVSELRNRLAEEQAARIEAERRAATLETKTVLTTDGAVPESAGAGKKVPGNIPRKYSGKLDDAEKARLSRLGVDITTIVLEENESIPPTGLYLGHNGRGYMIVPGEEVDVPNFLLNVLNDAVMSSPVVDSKTQKIVGYRNRMKYPYRKI
jgi:hypothetical protein